MLRSLACVLVVLAPPSLGLPAYLVRPLPSREELRLRPSGRPFTISVEGNVGAGKSTLLKYFQKVASAPRPGPHLTNAVPVQYEEVGVFMEPLDVWQNLNGTNFLDLTYSDPAR